MDSNIESEVINLISKYGKKPTEESLTPQEKAKVRLFITSDKTQAKPDVNYIFKRFTEDPAIYEEFLEEYVLLLKKRAKNIYVKNKPVEEWLNELRPKIPFQLPNDLLERERFLQQFEQSLRDWNIHYYEHRTTEKGTEFVFLFLDLFDSYPSRQRGVMDFLIKFCSRPVYSTLKEQKVMNDKGRNNFELITNCQNIISRQIFPLLQILCAADRLSLEEFKFLFNLITLTNMKFMLHDVSSTEIKKVIDYMTGREKSKSKEKLKNPLGIPILMNEKDGEELEKYLFARVRVLCRGGCGKFIDKLRDDHEYCEDCQKTTEYYRDKRGDGDDKGEWGGKRPGAGRPPKKTSGPQPPTVNP